MKTMAYFNKKKLKLFNILILCLLPLLSFAKNDIGVVATKTSKVYLDKFICEKQDCYLFFRPYDVGGMNIQAICNDCFDDWKQQQTKKLGKKKLQEIALNGQLALIRLELKPYPVAGQNWYYVSWLTLLN